MSVNLKQMDAYVSGSTVVFDESSQSVPTKDLASVDSESTVDTILGVKDGVVSQIAPSDYRPPYMKSPVTFAFKGSYGYIAANGTLDFNLVGDSSGGVKALMFMFGDNSNNIQIVLINTTTSANLRTYRLCDGGNPVTITQGTRDGYTLPCTITNNSNASYVYFLVFRGEVTF